MGVVRLDHQVCDRELQLVRPQPARLVCGTRPEPRTEEQQDVRGLADQQLAGPEKKAARMTGA